MWFSRNLLAPWPRRVRWWIPALSLVLVRGEWRPEKFSKAIALQPERNVNSTAVSAGSVQLESGFDYQSAKAGKLRKIPTLGSDEFNDDKGSHNKKERLHTTQEDTPQKEGGDHPSSIKSLPHEKKTKLTNKLYSQNGQDEVIINSFPSSYSGFFIDIGAHDGSDMSNTMALEKRGWSGLCVEPRPLNFASRKCLLLRELVTGKGGDVQFDDCSKTSVQGLSGIASKRVKFHKELDAHKCVKQNLTSRTMAQIVSAVRDGGTQVPRVVDFVSLDTEGTELEILQAWPKELCVRSWAIEHNCMKRVMINFKAEFQQRGCTTRQMAQDLVATNCPCGGAVEQSWKREQIPLELHDDVCDPGPMKKKKQSYRSLGETIKGFWNSVFGL